MDVVLQQGQAHGGEGGSFTVGDVLERQVVVLVPGTPLLDAPGGLLGSAKLRRAPVHRVLGKQVDDMRGGGLQRVCELGDGEVADGRCPVELGGGDACGVRPGEHEVTQ